MLSALSAGLQAPAASLISSPHLEGRRIPERRRCESRRADGRMYRVSQVVKQETNTEGRDLFIFFSSCGS